MEYKGRIRDRAGRTYVVSLDNDEEDDPDQIDVLDSKEESIGYVRFDIDKGEMSICDITISEKEYRHCGLGTALLRYVIKWAKGRGVKTIIGDVAPEMPGDKEWLLKWYSDNGFEILPKRPESKISRAIAAIRMSL